MRALSLLIKPASGHCNMRCAYCFYADVTDFRAVKNHKFMSADILEIIVKKALQEASEFCAFGFQGGEPTLAGLDFYKHFIKLVNKYNTSNIKTAFMLQTNGFALDADWARFLHENNFLTGLSIDGPPEIHDVLRKGPSNEGTHGAALKAAKLLFTHNAEFNVLSVVTKTFAARPDAVYRFYKRNNFRYIQFIPCLDGLAEERGGRKYSLDAVSYGHFLCRVFDLWYNDFTAGDYYSIRAFDNFIHMLAGRPPENCAMNGICNVYGLIEADGGVYPCDFYATDEFLLGNITKNSFGEMLGGKDAKAFISLSRQTHANCKMCEYFPICRGGCRRDREPFADGSLQLNYYCPAYKQFFKHALPRMKEIATGLIKQRDGSSA